MSSFFSRKKAPPPETAVADEQLPSFTLPKLKALHKILVDNKHVNNSNVKLVTENLRSLAEMVVYGDNKSELLFDFFCEKNMLALFLQIMRSEHGCPQAIYVQIFQTLSILCQCVKNDTSLYYLLSNNYINDMISFPFNFDEEELCEHFISFLKSLSLRLDSQTVQFFFIEEHGTFPLLTKAIQFLQYRDPMVRTAAQATILNIFRITDVRAREYSLKEEVIELFVSEVSSLMEGMYTAIVTLCVEYATYAVHPNTKDLTEGKIGDRIQDKLCSHICSMEDWLYYLQDIFSLHIHVLTSSLVEHLSIHYIYPVLLDPLLRRDQWKNCVIYNLATNNNTSTDASNGITADIESKEFHDDTSISLVVSLHLIIQIMHCIKDKQLRRSICVALLHPMSQKQRKNILTSKRKNDLRLEANGTSSILSQCNSSSDLKGDGTETVQSTSADDPTATSTDINSSLVVNTVPSPGSNSRTNFNILHPNPYRVAFQDLLTCKIDRFSLLASAVLSACLLRDVTTLNLCYEHDSNEPSKSSIDFAINTVHSFEALFLWPAGEDITHTSWSVTQSARSISNDISAIAVTGDIVEPTDEDDTKGEGDDHYDGDNYDNQKTNDYECAILSDMELDQWLEMSTAGDELIDVIKDVIIKDNNSTKENEIVKEVEKQMSNLPKGTTSRKSIEPMDMMESEISSRVQLLLHNADALSLVDMHTLALKCLSLPLDSTTPSGSALTISPTESILYLYLDILSNCTSHSLIVTQIVTYTIYDMIRMSHLTFRRHGVGASYPAPIGRSMRSVRKTIRQLATSILGRLDGWLADTVLSQFEEEARRYSQKATSWHNKIKKVTQDVLLMFPLTTFLHQRIGMDHVVPVSEVEICRREIQNFILLRSLYKRISNIYSNPLAVTEADDISKYAYDEIISSVIGIDDSKKYITGELMLMAGRQCVPSCVLLPNIDVPQFVATGVIHDPTAVAVSPTKSAAGSRRSSLSPKQSDKPSPPPAKRSSISILSFGSSSSSSLTEPPAPPVPTTEKPRKTGEAYFIHDDNFVLLAVPDKTKLEQGKILLGIPIFKTDAVIDHDDDRNLKLLIRSCDAIPAMEKVNDGKSSVDNSTSSLSILSHRAPHVHYQMSVGFETKKHCEQVMKHIESARANAKATRTDTFRNFLLKWTDSNKENPEI